VAVGMAVLVAVAVAGLVPVGDDVGVGDGVSVREGVAVTTAAPSRGAAAGAGSPKPTLSASEIAAGRQAVAANKAPTIKAPRPRVVARPTASNRRFRRSSSKIISSRILEFGQS